MAEPRTVGPITRKPASPKRTEQGRRGCPQPMTDRMGIPALLAACPRNPTRRRGPHEEGATPHEERGLREVGGSRGEAGAVASRARQESSARPETS